MFPRKHASSTRKHPDRRILRLERYGYPTTRRHVRIEAKPQPSPKGKEVKMIFDEIDVRARGGGGGVACTV